MIAAIAMTQLIGGCSSPATAAATPALLSDERRSPSSSPRQFLQQQFKDGPSSACGTFSNTNNTNTKTSLTRGGGTTTMATTSTKTALLFATAPTTLPKGLSFRKICSHCGRSRADHGDSGFGNACPFRTCAKCGESHDDNAAVGGGSTVSSSSRMGVVCTRATDPQQRQYTALLTAWAEAATVKRALQKRHDKEGGRSS